MSLKIKLLAELKSSGYCSRDYLRDYSRTLGYDIANADRQLRRLTHEGKVKPDFNADGFIIGYGYQEDEVTEVTKEEHVTQQARQDIQSPGTQQGLLREVRDERLRATTDKPHIQSIEFLG